MPTAIDTLLRLVPDNASAVLTHLQSHPDLADASDSSGYSLLHAASSYNQLTLLRALVTTYRVPVNIIDTDGETPLFVAETLDAAKCLVEELGADVGVKNEDGLSAEENALQNMEDGGEWAAIADYLERVRTGAGANGGGGVAVTVPAATAVDGDISGARPLAANGVAEIGPGTEQDEVHAPPPLPPNVRINMGTMHDAPAEGDGSAPDPEFRRRIEELAAREDFHGDEAQRELRRLVEDAVGGLAAGSNERDVRRRVE